jgi:hypothetical protein
LQHSIATNRRDGKPDDDPNQRECGLKPGAVIDPLADEHSEDQRGGEKPTRTEQ